MRGCLSLPFRLLSLALTVALLYLAWLHRDDLRRWVHRVTAEPAPAPGPEGADPATLARLARTRIDSIRRGRADSVVISGSELEALLAGEVAARSGGAVDEVSIRCGDGETTIGATLDAGRLPAGSLGPLTEWVNGRQPFEARGAIGLRRIGLGEWRLESLAVRGVPLPKALAVRLAGLLVPGDGGSITFAVPEWVTGLRVTPAGAILYGRGAGR